MKHFENEFKLALQLIKGAKKIVILSHRGPDADTVGSNLALKLWIKEQLGNDKEVTSACIDPPPRDCDHLLGFKEYVRDFDLSMVDLLIAVDAGADYMLEFGKVKSSLFSGTPPMINIDHHASNNNYGAVNIVDSTAAATTQIVYAFLKFAGAQITRYIATSLLHGLYFDTGSFMHSNTNAEVLDAASELVWKGADFKTSAKKLFRSTTIPQLKLYGTVLERAYVNSKGVTVSMVRAEDFERTGATGADTTGVVDYLNSIPDGRFCCLVQEDRKGGIKGSLRTRVDNVDLSQVAGIFGGGGHKKAAGFSLPGHLIPRDGKIKITE